ncbi:MAG: DNA-processing protein DprA [Solirubrobacterales bacterium]
MTRAAEAVRACAECLRRSWLLADLGPFIEVACDDRPGRRTPELLALDDRELVQAMAPSRARQMLDSNRGLAEELLRSELLAARSWAICRHDPAFPEVLLRAGDGPRCLIGRGDPTLLTGWDPGDSATVVGSRRPTREGLAVARSLGRDLARAGVVVVSGMAMGIDGAVHRGALEAGGPGRTVAVLGCGADRAYPGRHRGLHSEITAHGAVISEMPPGSRPWRWSFPARNRIMAALSSVTVVVEARSGSGSLITADFATSSGRDVGAVPGPVTSPLAEGTNSLIRDGAALIRDAGDVVEALGLPGHSVEWADAAERDPDSRAVLEAVSEGSSSVDPIAGRTGLTAEAVLSVLTRLEIEGLVEVSTTGDVVAVPAAGSTERGRRARPSIRG